ncbi:MAG: terpene cyclase/mutase family protein [Planctomycetales bacterium]|nr:terpene cyclase/mutase family protein [Planctomycetales bacterium]
MEQELEELGYLGRLMVQLTIAAALLPENKQRLHGDYVLVRQRPDGGWAGREGDSDIYYTSFALRSLAILGLLEGRVAETSAAFLRSRMNSHETIVDLLSLVYSAKLIEASCGLDTFGGIPSEWPDRLLSLLSQLRRDDGGFSKSLEGQTGSTYQTFLVLLCLELIGKACPDSESAYQFIMRQRQQDGGFLEIRVGKRSGTNPTAAALGALRVLGKLDVQVAEEATQFLCELQTDEGGFRANTRIPLPDLLSTFTSSVALADLGTLDAIDVASGLQYAMSMEQPQGGFRGFEFDPADDVEYTFYGLGALALLSSENQA